MDREEPCSQAADVPCGALDRVRDVVKLQIEEHGCLGANALDRGWAGRSEQLQPDLHEAHQARQLRGELLRRVGVGEVSRYDKRVRGHDRVDADSLSSPPRWTSPFA